MKFNFPKEQFLEMARREGDSEIGAGMLAIDPVDEGTVFIERLEDGTVQLKVRSPFANSYSFVNLAWEEWAGLKSLDLPVPEPEVKF